MKWFLTALVCLASVAPAHAQDWSGVARLLQSDLSGGRTTLQTFFIPDSPDPGTATRALGMAYVEIEGAAGNASLEVGLFRRTGPAWVLHRRVDGLFGNSPREPQLGPDGFFVTTDMPGPNDPRCCPSVPTRWYIDWSAGDAERVD